MEDYEKVNEVLEKAEEMAEKEMEDSELPACVGKGR